MKGKDLDCQDSRSEPGMTGTNNERHPRPDRGSEDLTVVFGGSFHPLHIGHLAILRALCERNEVARVLLVVSPKNPLKDSISEDSAADRLQAAHEALARHPELAGKVEVSDIEFRLGSPSYTIRTLDALREETPDPVGGDGRNPTPSSVMPGPSSSCPAPTGHLALAIGGDQLADFRRWKDYARILLEYGLLVYPREGFDSAALRDDLLAENPSYRITLLEAPCFNISSTELREGRFAHPEDFLM